ncbi:hypothetical protein [Chlorogloeopsis sp. ULAP02]|uniref:hypothetical protein n=1 Tax=Chlorogloeopsis sp. ULAP02 TaxID=3107926 RepID=UPI00313495CD
MFVVNFSGAIAARLQLQLDRCVHYANCSRTQKELFNDRFDCPIFKFIFLTTKRPHVIY